jgi:hypothetical protein
MKLVLGAMATTALIAVQGDGLVLHPLMKDVVAAQAQVLWDVGNRAMDDNGNPSAKNLKPADWPKLAAAAQAMKDASSRLATASRIVVAGAGDKIQDEGSSGSATQAQIQQFIDGDKAGFAQHARELADVADEFGRAAKAKDVKTLFNASGKLDEICEGCHLKFWYPNQGK